MNTKGPSTQSPFHPGEKEMQKQVGKHEEVEKFANRVITPFIPDQHRDFYSQLPFFVVGSVDNQGWPWVSILSGKPGFLHSPDSQTLHINAQPIPNDPLRDSIKVGAPLGMLGIELTTRRRNRLNARVSAVNDNGFAVEVDQAFGNCPQYIQMRSVDFVRDPHQQGENHEPNISRFTEIDNDTGATIELADTFFVSSFLPFTDDEKTQGVDVSHRGGSPGFVKVEGNTLTVPDYPGNHYFNTLGNFLLNPKAGLVFIDFETGNLLMLTGTVELLDDTNDEVASFKGAERAWRFTLDHGLKLENALPLRSQLKEYSMNSLLTGNWEQAQADLAAKKCIDSWRTFEVIKIEDESSVIRSFYLKPRDKNGLLAFKPGQFITVKIQPKHSEKPLTRTYTISSAPGENYYRISVKREKEGAVSNYLHSFLKMGDAIDVKSPVGGFYLDPTETRPAVLLAGGVGITPMMSMAQHVMQHGVITRHIRPLHIFHSAQTVEQRAFAYDLKNIENQTQRCIRYYSLISRAKPDEKAGQDFNAGGYITADVLRQTLPIDDYDFYLCGPAPFMQSLYDTLMQLGVDDKRVFAESFGPAQLKRKQDEKISEQRLREAESSIIKFTHSKFQQAWSKGEETLLVVAENHGLSPNFSCRNGVCGSCAVKLKSGSVSYRNKPSAAHNDDEVLICCAVPAEGSDTLELEL